jgi:hypothetical protein
VEYELRNFHGPAFTGQMKTKAETPDISHLYPSPSLSLLSHIFFVAFCLLFSVSDCVIAGVQITERSNQLGSLPSATAAVLSFLQDVPSVIVMPHALALIDQALSARELTDRTNALITDLLLRRIEAATLPHTFSLLLRALNSPLLFVSAAAPAAAAGVALVVPSLEASERADGSNVSVKRCGLRSLTAALWQKLSGAEQAQVLERLLALAQDTTGADSALATALEATVKRLPLSADLFLPKLQIPSGMCPVSRLINTSPEI